MKRHTSLAPLSRDHHNGLILAQLLKKDAPVYRGLPTDSAGKIAYARELYDGLLDGHFVIEENILHSLKGRYTDIDRLADEICLEHAELRSAFRALSVTHGHTLENMDRLGQMLEQHIRKEERELFPALQELCTEQELDMFRQFTENDSDEKGYPKQE